jgi:hypothetical protein
MNVKEAVQKVIDFTDDIVDEIQGKEDKFYQALAEHFNELAESSDEDEDEDEEPDEGPDEEE